MNNYTLEIGGRTLSVTLGPLAQKANGEALLRYGDTVVLATATMDNKDVDKGFFPLSVSYEEKFYAAGKIGGSRYTRREGKPSDRATLISRMIDRAIRPKFSEEFKKEVQIIVTCLSWDEENDPAMLGLLASSIALQVSDIPWNGPLGAVRIGQKDNSFILNPTYKELEEGDMDFVLAGFKNDKEETIVNMIEGGFEEEQEDKIMEAVSFAESYIGQYCDLQKKIKQESGKEKVKISEIYENEKVKEVMLLETEKIFSEKDWEKRDEMIEKLKEKITTEEDYTEDDIKYAFYLLEKITEKNIREEILKEDRRPDGRKIDEIRELDAKVGILPRTHGTGIFQRGETRSLSILTLGAPGDRQLFDDMELTGGKRFMHHYNFPPYSVGEVKPVRGPGRRDIGHGMLGEKALKPLIPSLEDFPYTIRVVSEILSSNGSTSMASVCSTTIALLDAGVPIKRPAAGISIGLITNEQGEYKLLTDIQGPEDHYGDMDFKVAGTDTGVTAIQMDVKIEGITKQMMTEALQRAKKTRLYILEKIKSVIPSPRENLSPYAPKISVIKINPEKIGEVIGPKGKVINKIMEDNDVTIDIEDTGDIYISSKNNESTQNAIEQIKSIIREIKVGEIFSGEVKKLFDFGAVVEILPGHEGLVHISEIADHRIDKVEDEVKLGDTVKVRVIKMEGNGKMGLSIKRAKTNHSNE